MIGHTESTEATAQTVQLRLRKVPRTSWRFLRRWPVVPVVVIVMLATFALFAPVSSATSRQYASTALDQASNELENRNLQ